MVHVFADEDIYLGYPIMDAHSETSSEEVRIIEDGEVTDEAYNFMDYDFDKVIIIFIILGIAIVIMFCFMIFIMARQKSMFD
jgi:hypothetical protein